MAPSPIFGRLNLERLKTATSPVAWLHAAIAAARRASCSRSPTLRPLRAPAECNPAPPLSSTQEPSTWP
eukprot:61028-Prymnesium_polylepis.1